MKVLVTGFEPFGGDAENASGEAVRLLEATWADATIEVIAAVLPVSFAGAGPALEALVADHAPDAVIAVGEAGGRTAITPEASGANEQIARIPDNEGAQPNRTPVVEGGPAVRASRLDPDDMVLRMRADGLPAEVSHDAGRFVCNHTAYLVAGLAVPGGFVHVPALRSDGRAARVGAETDAVGPGGAVRATGAAAPAGVEHPDARPHGGAPAPLTIADLARGLGHAVWSAATTAAAQRRAR